MLISLFFLGGEARLKDSEKEKEKEKRKFWLLFKEHTPVKQTIPSVIMSSFQIRSNTGYRYKIVLMKIL